MQSQVDTSGKLAELDNDALFFCGFMARMLQLDEENTDDDDFFVAIENSRTLLCVTLQSGQVASIDTQGGRLFLRSPSSRVPANTLALDGTLQEPTCKSEASHLSPFGHR